MRSHLHQALPLLLLLLTAGCAAGSGGEELPPGDAAGELPPAVDAGDLTDRDGTGEDALPAWNPVEPHVEHRGQFTVVWLAGTPYEMGYQQGELLHETVGEAIAFVESDLLLASLPLLAKDMGILDIAAANSYPDILEECQGLVDAAADVGMTMDYCLTLNFGDVMLEMMTSGIPGEGLGPGCSSLIARGAATPDGRLHHARNLDWGSMNIAIIHQHPVLFVRQPVDGIPHIYVGFPMNLSPYTGMNLAGIAIGSHEASPAGLAEQAASGRSHVQMLGQLLKHARTLDEVRAFLEGEPHMSAELFSVSDGDGGTGAIFEMTATAVRERTFAEEVLFATNHFLHPEMVEKHAKPGSGSVNRIKRFQQLVEPDGEESAWGDLDEQHIADVMRDPIDPAVGEAEPDEELEAKGWDNDGSLGANGPMHFVIFDPARRLFYVNAGVLPLHKQPYTCFSLEELLGVDGAETCPLSDLP